MAVSRRVGVDADVVTKHPPTTDQLYLAERIQRLAAHEERIRLARDLHDGRSDLEAWIEKHLPRASECDGL